MNDGYVPIPKDLKKVKTKVAFNLTRRQLIGFTLAGFVGIKAICFPCLISYPRIVILSRKSSQSFDCLMVLSISNCSLLFQEVPFLNCSFSYHDLPLVLGMLSCRSPPFLFSNKFFEMKRRTTKWIKSITCL